MTIFSYPFGDDFFWGFKPHQNDLTMKIREGNQRQGFAVFITFYHCFVELVEGNVFNDDGRSPPFQRACANILFSQRSNIFDWWFGTFFIFPYIGNFIIPTDALIFFRGLAQPPTRYGQILRRKPGAMNCRTSNFQIARGNHGLR